jgi:membrane protein DedA with SNARE-associated domain/membrane-associated phospholipid phosphatase
MLELFLDLVSQYGYFIVVVTIMLECAGVPMPGETALIVAAAVAGTGKLDIRIVIAVATLAAIVGDNGGYWIGRYFGRSLIARFGKIIHLNEHRIKKIEGYFSRHGSKTVFFGRFFSILRTYSAFFAGIFQMPYGTFTLYNALGGVTWATTFGILGFLFGQNLPLLEKIARTVGWALTLPLILVIVIMLFWRWLLKHQEQLVGKIPTLRPFKYINKWVASHSFQIHWVLRHWKARQYIALHLATGFVVIAASLYVFGRLSFNPLAEGMISGFDREVLRVFSEWSTPLATNFFTTFSNLSAASMVIFGIFATIVFFLKGRHIQLTIWLVGVLGGQLLTLLLKLTVARARPITEQLSSAIDFGYSFPSGHAMGIFIMLGLLSYFFILTPGTFFFRTGILFTALVAVLLVGFSRLYLGINFFSDVIGGFVVGLLWLTTCISVAELYRRGQVGDRRGKKRKKVQAVVDEKPPAVPQTGDHRISG